MSSSSDRETAELLDELESTLAALRDEVGDDNRRRRRRPPTPVELLRVTERHTIPTLVATLEATVQALELVRELLRLVDPERSRDRGDAAGDRLGEVGESAAAGAERVLVDLRRALAAEELPDDEATRTLVSDARALAEEVETRLREARREAGRSDGRRASDDRRASGDRGGVSIDVTPEGEHAEDEAEGTGESETMLDVDAELESIRDEVRDDQDATR